ncbi:hypothetical protein JCM6882_000372 [Rhodosporidiobolus microsporus]
MSANPTLYADSLSSSRSPSAVFHSISTRLALSRALTADLAAYYHERAALEDSYVKGLNRLQSRLHSAGKETVFKELDAVASSLEGGNRQADQLLGSGLASVRKTLESEVGDVARCHEAWRKKVAEEVERSLRDSLGGGEWIGWNRGEEQLRGSVKEYEGLVDKVQKAQTKSTRSSKPSSKLLTSQSALSSLGSSLTQSLPAFLTQSQALDLSHSAFLKEALVRAGTASSDLGRERMEGGERVLVSVLGVDESAEAEEWALREGMRLGGGNVARANGVGAGSGAGVGLASVGEFGETESVGSGAATATGRERVRQETQSSDAASTRSGSVVAPPPSSSAGGAGVERSRTMSRPPPAGPIALPTTDDDRRSSHTVEKDGNKKSGLGGKLSSFLSGGGGSSSNKSRDRSSSIPNSAKYANFAAAPDAPPVPPVSSPPMQRSDTNASGGSDLLGGSAAGYGGAAPLQPESSTKEKRKSLMPGGGGGGLFRRQSKMSSLNDFDASPSASAGSPSLAAGAGQQQQQQQAQFASQLSAEPAGAGGSPRVVDSEGFSVPPEGYDRAIGAGANGGSGSGSGNLMDEDDEPMETPSSIPRLSIAPTLPASSPSPLVPQDSEAERLAALRAVQTSLGAPTSAGLSRRATARGRRSEGGQAVRNTVYGGGGAGSLGLGASTGSASGSVLEPPREVERRPSVASDDDVPLAVAQQQQQSHRRAPPPPPTASSAAAAAAATSSPPLPPTPQSGTASPTFVSTPTSPSFAAPPAPPSIDGGRTMSILSTSSSLASSSTAAAAAHASRPDPFAGELTPGLRAEVRETVNVLLKNGEAVRVMVTGEVGVSYRPPATATGTDSAAGAKEGVRVRFSGLDGAEKTAPNPAYLQPAQGAAAAAAGGEYTLLLPALLARNGATTTVLKYQLALATPAAAVPFSIKPTWRCEPGLSRAIVAYSLNRESALFPSGTSASSPFGEDDSDEAHTAGLDDVRIELHLAPSSPVSIASFQSKPSTNVALLPGGRGLSFALGSLSPSTFSSSGGAEEKLLASLTTDPGAGAAVPGQVSVSWAAKGRTVGAVGVEVVESEEEEEGLREVRRETVAGTYKAT